MRIVTAVFCLLWVGCGGWAFGADNVIRFEKEGVFHRPTTDAETWRTSIPVPTERGFDRLTVSLTVTVGPWNASEGKTNHAVFWLNRGERWSENVLGYVNVFGPTRPRVKMANNVDQPRGVMLPTQADWTVKPGHTYRFEYVYDAAAREIRLTVSEGGAVVASL
ncbi:MAG: hypothetical protein ACYTGQ_07225, partial [Planctomycetota bacterium]